MTYDYGKCEVCDTPMKSRRVKQDFWIKEKLVVVENVPAGVCPRCGEKVVRADVGRWLAEIFEDAGRLANATTITVPVIRFDHKEATS